MMTTITISRQYGSGGDEIAQRVCETLGYQVFSKDLIEQVAAEAGLSEQDVENLSAEVSSENFKIRSFFEKMLDDMALASARMMFPDALPSVPPDQPILFNEGATFALVQKAINVAFQSGNMVIVGRGGQAFLKDRPDVLHVRIVAPLEDCIQRVKEQICLSNPATGNSFDLHRAARDLVTRRDAASAAYLQHFYHADWNDPMFYHLIINTGKTPIDQAVDLIVRMAAGPQVKDQSLLVEASKG